MTKINFTLKALGISFIGGLLMALFANLVVTLIYGWVPHRAIYLASCSILGFLGIGCVLIMKVLKRPH
jgi:hypothetical protein